MITIQRLKDLLFYDPETGIWIWLKPTCNRMRSGDIAGRIDTHGHAQITVDGVAYDAFK